MRLNQFLAKHLGLSRRKADDIIKSGSTLVNGKIGQLHFRISPEDDVEVDQNGKIKRFNLKQNTSKVLLLYKPGKVVTTASDPQGRKTVFDLLPKKYHSFKTAGRLDYLSEGLLVLSNNGHLILSLTHPKFKTKKKYLVCLDKNLSSNQIQIARSGILEIDGYKLNSVDIQLADLHSFSYLNLNLKAPWYVFTLSEGRNRQIRKMAEIFNRKVLRLIRIGHGQFHLDENLFKKGFIEVNSLGNSQFKT